MIEVANEGVSFFPQCPSVNIVAPAIRESPISLVELGDPACILTTIGDVDANVVLAITVEIANNRLLPDSANVASIDVIFSAICEPSVPLVELDDPTRILVSVGDVDTDVVFAIAIKVSNNGSFSAPPMSRRSMSYLPPFANRPFPWLNLTTQRASLPPLGM